MNYEEIKELTDKELHGALRDERDHLQKLKFGHAVTQLENPGKITASRRLVARFLTEINRRKKEINKSN
ncbi:MAG: 50S ribosomal protein L29 [Flavobacteriales bacterium]|nr:50S ribosomal protein L29 [Flavobacteriales bacterium]